MRQLVYGFLCVALRGSPSVTLFGTLFFLARLEAPLMSSVCPQVSNARAFISVFVYKHGETNKHCCNCGQLQQASACSLSRAARHVFLMGHRCHLSTSLWHTVKFPLVPAFALGTETAHI